MNININTNKKYIYRFISPTNDEFITTSAVLFCQKHKLDHADITAVSKHRRKQHKGWTAERWSKE